MRTRTGWNGARFPPRSFSPYTGCVLGISGPEFLVIVLVAVIVIGPQRLPEYTRRLTQAVRRLRVFLDDTKEQIAEEVGPELADLNLSDLDPRNYDPRKIVRDALGEDLDAIQGSGHPLPVDRQDGQGCDGRGRGHVQRPGPIPLEEAHANDR